METTKNINLTSIWNEILENIKDYLGESSNYNAWFKNTSLLKIENNRTVVINIPNELTRDYLNKKYKNLLLTEINKKLPEIKVISFNIFKKKKTALNKTHKQQISTVSFDFPAIDKTTGLSSNYTFKNLIVAPYIQLVHAAAQAIINKVGMAYNPLFIYGPSGVGKTHLVQAIGNKLLTIYPNLRIKYIEAEDFCDEFVVSVKDNNVSQFRNKYKNYQVLIIDDVHFFAGKDRTILEIFHIFNSLTNNNWQIIFSSDKNPKELEGIEERIKTRFYSGMTLEIQSPSAEDLRLILTEKAKKIGLDLSDDAVLDYITQNIDNNVRDVEGILKSLQLFTEIEKKPLTLLSVKTFIKNNIKPKNSLSIAEIVKQTCKYYEIDPELIPAKIRKREIVMTRQIIMYILREYMDMSYSIIGKKLGKRDHTTVMHACDKIDNMLEIDNKLQNDIEKIKQILNL